MVQSVGKVRDIFFPNTSAPALGPTHLLIHWVPRLFFGVKEAGTEVEHLTSRFRMSGAIRPVPPPLPLDDFMVFTRTSLTFFF